MTGRPGKGSFQSTEQEVMMTRRILGLAVVALAGGLLATAGHADTAKRAVSDADFVMLASATDLAEVTLGRLAARQATSEDVKRFAQRMVDDHSKSSQEMLALTNRKRG